MIQKIRNVWSYYLVAGMFSVTRMGIGSTSVVFMLSKGLQASDVATVKIIQAITVLMAEVPTGLIADMYGRRMSILASVLCAILSFACFIVGDNTFYFGLAEILNALSISFWSGAFEALVVDHYQKQGHQGGFLEVLFSRMASVEAVGTMVGGLVGGLIATYDSVLPFYFSSTAGVVTALLIAVLIKPEVMQVSSKKILSFGERATALGERIRKNLAISIESGFSDPLLRPYFFIQIVLQFVYQPIFHYWQPYFNSTDASVNETTLGVIFFCYVGANFLFSALASRLVGRTKNAVSYLILAEIFLMSFGLAVMNFKFGFWSATVAFVLMQGAGTNLRSLLGANFNRYIPSEQRATILSSVSLISRLGMLLSLIIINQLLKVLPIQAIFGLSAVAMLSVFPLLGMWERSSQKAERYI